MADQQTLLLYTRETAEAIKKAMRLPPTPAEDNFYKPSLEQRLLSKPQVPLAKEERYSGPFAFSFNEKGELVISAGFLNRNGDVIEIKEQIITELKTGYICLDSHLINKGEGKKEWSEPAIVFLDKPLATAYPLGRRTEKDGIVRIECYEVPMAFILATRQCPLAGGK